MSTISINYGTRTEFGTDTNLNSLASNAAKPMGGVSNSSLKAIGFKIDATIKLATTGVTSTGFLTFYIVESTDGGTTYTDGINVTTTGDIASNVKNAPRIYLAPSANANSQVINVSFSIGNADWCPKDFSIIVLNNSGASFSSSANTMYYTPINYSVA